MLFDREITPYIRCSWCRELIGLGAESCPYCQTPIDQVKAKEQASNYVAVTKAIQSAQTITNRDLVVLLFLGYTFWMRWSGRDAFYDVPRGWLWAEAIFAIFWLFPILAIVRWFHLHGKLTTHDKEYLLAQKDVGWSLRLWIVAQVFHLLLVIAYP